MRAPSAFLVLSTSAIVLAARDVEVRVYTGDDHKVVWEGTYR